MTAPRAYSTPTSAEEVREEIGKRLDHLASLELGIGREHCRTRRCVLAGEAQTTHLSIKELSQLLPGARS